ncbi:DUF397 domain-containing protein [Nocardia gipuzkoensis]
MKTPVLGWKTSSYSGTNGGECVEVAFDGRRVLVRDTKFSRNPANRATAQPVIEIPRGLWGTFLAAATSETLQVPVGLPAIVRRDTGEVSIVAADGTTLTFTAGEWVAFKSGVNDGEFAAA